MKRDVQAVVLVLIGGALLRISVGSDMYLRYVKEGLRPAIIAAGVILLAIGLYGAVVDGVLRRHERVSERVPEGPVPELAGGPVPQGTGPEKHEAHGHDHTHDHTHGPKVAWLLTLPVFALFLIAPPALGSYTAERAPSTVAKPADSAVEGVPFDPLPPGDPQQLTLAEFSQRAVWDTAHTLQGRTVTLTGFATPGKDGDGKDGADGTWVLNRLAISCCAADAQVRRVEVQGPPAPAKDAWVTVTGTWRPSENTPKDSTVPRLDGATVVPVAPPKDPYE